MSSTEEQRNEESENRIWLHALEEQVSSFECRVSDYELAMPVHGHRIERLTEQIHEDVAEMVAGELKDPRIGLATVTRVELSPDLRYARVLVSVLGDEEAKAESLAGLASAAGYVRRELGRRLGLRRTPEVLFVLDRGLEEQQKVEKLLEESRHDA